MISPFLWGMTTMAGLVAGLFFLRFWRKTRDRLFAIFAVAFWLLALQSALLLTAHHPDESRPLIYMIRLAAFLLIIIGIVDKNRAAKSASSRPRE